MLPKNSRPPLLNHDEDSSDSDAEQQQRPVKPKSGPRAWLARVYEWRHLTLKQKQVLKCSFAYTIGALFTFVPALNKWVGATSGKKMVGGYSAMH